MLSLSGQSASERIEQLIETVKWDQLLPLAEQHGLVALVHQRFARDCLRIPNWREFENAVQVYTRRALWLSAWLQRVLAFLESHGIEALPYKGPLLAAMLYGNISLRQYTDLDVLVRPGDLPRAKAALNKIGLAPHIDLTTAEEQAYVRSGYETIFDGFANRNLVELQWHILPRFYAVDFDMDGLFSRARSVEFNGMSMRSLSREDLFLALCVHAAKHLWARLSWLYDIARLSASAEIDWSAVEATARRLGIMRITAVNLQLSRDLFGTIIPTLFRTKREQSRCGKQSGAFSRLWKPRNSPISNPSPTSANGWGCASATRTNCDFCCGSLLRPAPENGKRCASPGCYSRCTGLSDSGGYYGESEPEPDAARNRHVLCAIFVPFVVEENASPQRAQRIHEGTRRSVMIVLRSPLPLPTQRVTRVRQRGHSGPHPSYSSQ